MRLSSLRALALPIILMAAAACGDDITTPGTGTDATVMMRKDLGIGGGDAAALDSGVTSDDSGAQNDDTGTQNDDTGVASNDTGVSQGDTGVPPGDTGVPQGDTGVPETDTGVVTADTGVPPADTGVPEADSGVVVSGDTGVPPGDTGVPPVDGGVVADTGVPPTDGGVVTPDGGVVGNFDPNASAGTLAQAICAFYDRCEPARLAATARTVAQCVTENTAALAAQFTAAAGGISAGATTFDQASFDACRNAYGSADCQRGLDPGVCGTFFTGNRPNGAACALSSECAPNLFCTATAGTCGQCAPRVGVGQSCLTAACNNGLVCAQTSQTAFTCVALVDENATCGTTGIDDCRGHLWCTGSQPPFVCRRPTGIGQACTTDSTTTPDCDPFMGGACLGGMCQQVTYGGVNASCTPPAACNTTAVCTANTCAARPGAGGTCNANVPCAEGFFCNGSSICEARRPAAQPCTTSTECQVNLVCGGPQGSRTCQALAYRTCGAGTDGGVADSGTPVDSGVADAGTPVDGGTPGDAGVASDPFVPATVANTYAQALCGFYNRCEPGRFQFFGWNTAQCTTETARDLSDAYAVVSQAITAGRARFSQAQLDACVAALGAADCVLEADPAACNFIAGTRTLNQPCDRSFECSPELFCGITTAGATCGTCVARRTNGQTCNPSPCGPNSACVQTGATTFQCVPANVAENGVCGSIATGVCRGDLQCVGTGATGNCVRPAALNGACTDDLSTAPDCNFDQSLVCNNGTCASFAYNPPGMSCAGLNDCTAAGYCNTANNTCTALPTNGQPCATADDLCAQGTYCDGAGTCRTQRMLNQSCADDFECEGALLCLGTTTTTCQADAFQVCN